MISIAPEAFVWSRVGFEPPDLGKRPLVVTQQSHGASLTTFHKVQGR